MLKYLYGLAAALTVGIASAAWTPASAQDALLDEIISRGELRVGWSTSYPQLYKDPKTDQVVGISVDIMTELAKQMGVKLVMVEDSWATLIAGLQARKFDMTPPAFAIRLPRAVAVTYSKPVFQSPIGLMVRKADAEKWANADAMDETGIRVTTTLGSVTDQVVTNQMSKAEILRVKSDADSITQLLTNRAEAWASTEDAFEPVAKEHADLVPLNNGTVGSTFIAIAVPKGEYHLRDYLNYFIDEIQDQGFLEKTFDKYDLPHSYLIEE